MWPGWGAPAWLTSLSNLAVFSVGEAKSWSRTTLHHGMVAAPRVGAWLQRLAGQIEITAPKFYHSTPVRMTVGRQLVPRGKVRFQGIFRYTSPFFGGIQTLMYGIVSWISAAICGILRAGVSYIMTPEWTIVPLRKWRVCNEKKTHHWPALLRGLRSQQGKAWQGKKKHRQLDATSPRNHNQVKVSTKRWGLQNGWWSWVEEHWHLTLKMIFSRWNDDDSFPFVFDRTSIVNVSFSGRFWQLKRAVFLIKRRVFFWWRF